MAHPGATETSVDSPVSDSPSSPGVRIVGWPLVGWATLAVGLVVAAKLAIYGIGEEGFRAVVRATAGTSVILFSSAYAASSLARVWPTRTTRWLLLNRRYLGVSFAVSHLYHLIAILALTSVAGEGFSVDPVTLIGGGLGYLFIAAMAATSFDSTAAWLGPRSWQRLHSVGAHYLWFVFALSYVTRATQSPTYAFFSVLLLGGLTARIAARFARRRARPR